jgi:hypothetical protein
MAQGRHYLSTGIFFLSFSVVSLEMQMDYQVKSNDPHKIWGTG